jgi:hypothetical protein
MAWQYELRGEDHRLVEMLRGFLTQKEAEEAGQRAMQAIGPVHSARHPAEPEKLTLIIVVDATA